MNTSRAEVGPYREDADPLSVACPICFVPAGRVCRISVNGRQALHTTRARVAGGASFVLHPLDEDEGTLARTAVKPRPTLVPAVAVLEVAQLMAEQEAAHGDRWRDHPAEHHLDAAWRHLLRHQAGEVLDPKSGRPHAVHATARMMMAVAVGSTIIAEPVDPTS